MRAAETERVFLPAHAREEVVSSKGEREREREGGKYLPGANEGWVHSNLSSPLFIGGQAVQRFLHLSRIAFWPATQA